MKTPLSLGLAVAAAFALASPSFAQDLHDLKTVPGTATPDAGTPNDWVKEQNIDLGTHLEGEIARGSWHFKNPTDQAQQIKSFQPSCTCSKVVVRLGSRIYRIENQPRPHTIYRVEKDANGVEQKEMVESVPIGPTEEGTIDLEVDLHNVSGVKEASATIHTSDEKNRMLTLKAKAVATQFFRISPPEINLSKMNWQDTKDFTVRITSPIQKDFEVTGYDPLPDKMQVSYRKEINDGEAVWIVEGKYGPGVDPKAGGGIINLKTNVQDKSVQVRVIAWVEGPLNIRPGSFVPLGRIAKGVGAKKDIEIEPTDDFDLKVEKVELQNLTIDEKLVTVTPHKDGKILKLTLEISPDAPVRLIRGDIVVHLNHPALQVQEFQFNGFVR